MAAVLLSFLALTFTLEDVTLENGVRVVTSPGPPAEAVAEDGSVVVVIGEGDLRSRYAGWPRPSPSPSGSPSASSAPGGESWHIESGPARLVIEWAAPTVDETLLLAALLSRDGAVWLRRDGLLTLTVKAGWPPEARRWLDGELERLAALPARELAPVKEACSAFATPRSSAERAQRLLQVTLATGNPRLYRELPDRCGRLTVGTLAAAVKQLYRRPRRIIIKTPVEPGTVDP
jgi:hypothetical protein